MIILHLPPYKLCVELVPLQSYLAKATSSGQCDDYDREDDLEKKSATATSSDYSCTE
jgi:hypothetical protein